MNVDKFGQTYYESSDLVNLLYQNPKLNIDHFPVVDPDQYNTSIDQLHLDLAKLVQYQELDCSVEQFDRQYQSTWYMPETYQQLDIAKWLIDQCQTQAELQRIGQELLLYQERNLFSLLQYLKYLVDTMRDHNIVWGVGRGSSVASYALYLIGIHKVNSLYYDLPISEFLKD